MTIKAQTDSEQSDIDRAVNASRVFPGPTPSAVTRAEWEAAMREHGIVDEDKLDDLWEAGRIAKLRSKLPERIALCPEHSEEFYYPLAEGEGRQCPACPLAMTVYVREGSCS